MGVPNSGPERVPEWLERAALDGVESLQKAPIVPPGRRVRSAAELEIGDAGRREPETRERRFHV